MRLAAFRSRLSMLSDQAGKVDAAGDGGVRVGAIRDLGSHGMDVALEPDTGAHPERLFGPSEIPFLLRRHHHRIPEKHRDRVTHNERLAIPHLLAPAVPAPRR